MLCSLDSDVIRYSWWASGFCSRKVGLLTSAAFLQSKLQNCISLNPRNCECTFRSGDVVFLYVIARGKVPGSKIATPKITIAQVLPTQAPALLAIFKMKSCITTHHDC